MKHQGLVGENSLRMLKFVKKSSEKRTGLLLDQNNYFCHRLVNPSGPGPLIIDASRLPSDILHSVGLLWTSDQPDKETSTLQHTVRT